MTRPTGPRLRRPGGEPRRRRGDPGRRRRARWPRCPASGSAASRGCTRPRPVGVADQPEFRNAVVALDVAGRPGPGDRRARAAARAQGARAGLRPPPRAGAGARASSTSTCSSSDGRGSPSSARPRRVRSTPRPSRPRPRGCLVVPASRAPTSGCSCSRRWPTWRPGSCRPAGACRSRRRAAASSTRRGPGRGPRRSRPGTPAAGDLAADFSPR